MFFVFGIQVLNCDPESAQLSDNTRDARTRSLTQLKVPTVHKTHGGTTYTGSSYSPVDTLYLRQTLRSFRPITTDTLGSQFCPNAWEALQFYSSILKNRTCCSLVKPVSKFGECNSGIFRSLLSLRINCHTCLTGDDRDDISQSLHNSNPLHVQEY